MTSAPDDGPGPAPDETPHSPFDDVVAVGGDIARETLFHAIANYTYDWETWIGADNRPHWINPAVERISGYSAEECYAMNDYPLAIVHADDRAMIAACLEAAARGESGNDVEFKIRHKHGLEKWGAVSWQTIADETGTPMGYRTSVRDITLRKQTEQALRKARHAAEKANADKSRFLAAASHDLRQPIQAASMFTSALADTQGEDERRRIVSAIADSLDATRDLLDALLDVSRLDAGVLEPDIRSFPVADVLEQIETEFDAAARGKGLTLTVIASSRSVTTDPVMLLRILRNLVSNAVRYTERGRILVGARRRTERVRIDVLDTGIGIADSKLDEIFDDFRQLDNPERDRRRGLGLGLAIVKRKADLLGLDVSVRSTPGRGSAFSVAVPAADGPSPVRQAFQPYEDIDISGARVLYIDDDPVQLEAMATVLRQWGVAPLSAQSAQEAVDILAASAVRPDAVIADYRLRDNQDGAQAIRRVVGALGTPVPAVILTGDTEPARIAEATASGYALLHKPVSPSILKQTLNDVMGRRVRTPAPPRES
jgi:PAS domain S-box-containing protein